MSKYSIIWLEKKNNDWMVLNVKDEAGTETKEVSLNRTNKKGEVFPGFDGVVNGGYIEGELWTSQAGKHYLFAPKPKLERPTFMKGAQIEKAMDKKNENIKQAQDRSAWMWAKTNASTLLAGIMNKINTDSNDAIAEAVLDLATKIYNMEPTTPF